MISGVAFLCIHAQIKNSVLPQIPTGPMGRSQTILLWQTATHTLQHWKNSDDGKSGALLDSQAGLWYFFPSASDEPGWKKRPAFFCVCVTPFLCRWGSAGASHAVWIASGVLCWDKRGRTCIHWNCCTPKSKSGQQMNKREKDGLLQACSGEDYSASQLPCPLHGVIHTSAVVCALPLLFTVLCRISMTTKVQYFFLNGVLFNSLGCYPALALAAAWQ